MRRFHKRKRSHVASRFRKRRHTVHKRRGRKNTVFSSRTLNPINTQIKRGRKISGKRFRSMLWNYTTPSVKYKSARTFESTLTAPATNVVKQISAIAAMDSSAGGEFFTVAGGLQAQNFGVVPNLGVDLGSVVIRGGILYAQISLSPVAADPLVITVELRRCRQQLRNAADTADSTTIIDYLTNITGTTRPLTWTMDDAPDRQEYLSKAYLRKTMTVTPGQMFRVEHRLRVEKWDIGEFQRYSRGFFWIIESAQTFDILGVGVNFLFNRGHDLSFVPSADAI